MTTQQKTQLDWLNHHANSRSNLSYSDAKPFVAAPLYLCVKDDSREPISLGWLRSFKQEVAAIRATILSGKTADWDVSPSNPMRVCG